MSSARAACAPSPHAISLDELAPGVWSVQAARGEADADNRGRVSNLLLVRAGARVWLIGSGPSPAFGRALACRAHAVAGQAVTDVIAPWARPELVLGARAFARTRHWAHADVARAMRRRCPHCVTRLRSRLGHASGDLGVQPARAVDRHLRGGHGTLGPFDWWHVKRSADASANVTLWSVRGTPVLTAHGLLWAGSVPELRDSDLAQMTDATLRLRQIASLVAGGQPLLLGEQGVPAGLGAVDAHVNYWRALALAIGQAQSSGADGHRVGRVLPGVEPALLHGATHDFNWQRAWRQAEDASFAPLAPAPGRAAFQRNLR